MSVLNSGSRCISAAIFLEHVARPVDIFVIGEIDRNRAAFPMPRLVLVTLVTALKGMM